MSGVSKAGLAPVGWDDLPRHSAWPKRLLSLETFAVRQKDEREVMREFEDEKWSALLARARAMRPPTLLEVERAHADFMAPFLCYIDGGFHLATYPQILQRHLDLYAEVLQPHLPGASCLIEFGAGYGSKLLGLAQRQGFARLPLMAGECSQSGRELISLLAEACAMPIAVGNVDFWRMACEGLAVPENAVIFTSYAVHYIPLLAPEFVDFLAAFKPRAIVLFEPCYEHYSMQSLHGMMCRRYVEMNDYTRNLASVIDVGSRRHGMSVRTRKNVLGGNAFLPISVIECVTT